MALIGALEASACGGPSEPGPIPPRTAQLEESPRTTGTGLATARSPDPPPPSEEAADTSSHRDRLAFFLSGHSLTDDPLADEVVSIAQGLGVSAQYNEQIVIGSPIRVRARGMSETPGVWEGYRTGKNHGGSTGLDVISELRAPRTIEGRYDALIITERHDVVDVLIWEDTVRFLRHFHDRVSDGNPEATTYLYHPWLEVRDLADPREWIAYERAAQPVWECVADRVDLSLRAEGLRSHVRSIPVGAALATLVERAVAGRVPGLGGPDARGVTRRIFSDDVHMTPLGFHFVALVTTATVLGRSPEGLTAPAEIEPALASALQSIAWESVRASADRAPRSPSSCRARMRGSFCATYASYTRRPEFVDRCLRAFDDDEGPFDDEPASGGARWFAAP